MRTIIHSWITHSSQFPSPSMSFSSKAWKGIKAGLCNNWGKVSAKRLIHFRKQVVNKLTTNSASSLFFWRFTTIGNFIAGIVQMLTCEEVITVMPMLVASLYRCSSTSTLVALQSSTNLGPTVFDKEREKEMKETKRALWQNTYLVHSSRIPNLGWWKNKRAWQKEESDFQLTQ